VAAHTTTTTTTTQVNGGATFTGSEFLSGTGVGSNVVTARREAYRYSNR
jgi:hypothetical protein